MPKRKKDNSGQSLMEMIFALAILLTVITAVLALAANNLGGQKESESQLLANNLAREGIEAVRGRRDSNWLAGANWDVAAAGWQAIAEFDSSANSWQLNFNYADDLLYLANGVCSHNNSGQPSIFRRHLIFNDICQTNEGQEAIKPDGEFCDLSEKKVGFKVKSIVGWTEHGRSRQVVLEDLLFAWK